MPRTGPMAERPALTPSHRAVTSSPWAVTAPTPQTTTVRRDRAPLSGEVPVLCSPLLMSRLLSGCALRPSGPLHRYGHRLALQAAGECQGVAGAGLTWCQGYVVEVAVVRGVVEVLRGRHDPGV